jgi:hypothetical protein
MTDKTYMIRFKSPETSTRYMSAASVEVNGDNLVLLNSVGEPVVIFLLEIVESWTVINLAECAPEGFFELNKWGGSTRFRGAPMKID